MSEIMVCPECAEKMIEISADSLAKDSREGIIQTFYCEKCDVTGHKLKNPQGLDVILSETLGHPTSGDWDKDVPSEKYLGKLKNKQVKGRTSQEWGKMLEEYACSYLAENLKGWELKRGEIIGDKEYDCLGWKGEPRHKQPPDLAIEMHFPFSQKRTELPFRAHKEANRQNGSETRGNKS